MSARVCQPLSAAVAVRCHGSRGVRVLNLLTPHPDRVISARVPMLDEPLPPLPVDWAP